MFEKVLLGLSAFRAPTVGPFIFSIIPHHQGQNKVNCLPPESGRAAGPAHIFQQPGHIYYWFLHDLLMVVFDFLNKNY